MARQQAARRPVDVIETARDGKTTGGSSSSSTLILFEPELAVRAIVFHLADEGISPRVDANSVKATVARLRRAALCPQMEQWMWARLSNARRLEWLLQKTNTTSRLIDDEMSVLAPTVP